MRRPLERRNGILLGVCGGIAEHVGWDPTLVRILFLFSGLGIGAYLILALIMPKAEY